MEHQLRLPILPSQCYSSSDYVLESRHGNATVRQPLQESTGNAQHGEMHGELDRIVSSYGRRARIEARRSRNHSPITPSILTPPIVPTQALGSTYYGSPEFTRPQERHESHPKQQQRRGRRADVNPLNPLSLYPAFQDYRVKQDEKDDKSDQKWPPVLEDAFLEALLIIPHIGRSKFVVNQNLHGRNMLIREYLRHYYYATIPRGVKPDPTGGERGRKQVSSHIQVFKGIFKSHRCCHIILPREIKGKGKDKNEAAVLPSLKRHGVLVALSENRFPRERANYAYFARILELDNHIVIRPKRCWIFVSLQHVVVSEDGSGQVQTTGQKLARHHYPHLRRNFERQKWSKEEQEIVKGYLVHEYTKMFAQVESGTLRELSAQWKSPFPDLHQQLETMIAANAREDIVAAEAKCDIIHMHVTLEANTKGSFPAKSELNSWVEINIEKPHLLSHRWKVHTRLVRPSELAYSGDKSAPEPVYEVSAEIPIQYEHGDKCVAARAGGDALHCVSPNCRRDYVMVPFPADVWARTLSNCAEYPAHPPVKEVKIIKKDDKKGKKSPRKIKAEKEKTVLQLLPDSEPTQMDLVPRIAMMQEIWSCPPASPQGRESGSQSSQRWTRRGLILWSFQTLHSRGATGDEKGALLTAAGGGTTWRFLTILDPMSEYHLQNSLLPNTSEDNTPGPYYDSPAVASFAPTSRDMIMSPNPSYQEHLNASMSENFGAAWGPPHSIDPLVSGSAAQAAYDAHLLAQTTTSAATTPTAYPILASYGGHSGLATPPPTASLTSSFATSFDSQPTPGNYMAPPATMDDPTLSFNGTTNQHHQPAGYNTVTYSEVHDQMPAWDTGSAWPAPQAGGYAPVPASHHDIHWQRTHHSSGVHHHQQEEHWSAPTHPEDTAHHQHLWRPSPSLSHIGHQHQHGTPIDNDNGWADVEASGASSMGTRTGSGTVTPHPTEDDQRTDDDEEEEEGGVTDEDLSREWEEVGAATGTIGGGVSSSLADVRHFQGHSVLDEGLQHVPIKVEGGEMGVVDGYDRDLILPRGIKREREDCLDDGDDGDDDGDGGERRMRFAPAGGLGMR